MYCAQLLQITAHGGTRYSRRHTDEILRILAGGGGVYYGKRKHATQSHTQTGTRFRNVQVRKERGGLSHGMGGDMYYDGPDGGVLP